MRADGTLARDHGVKRATHVGTGTYIVVFTTTMTGCAYEATPGDPASGAIFGPVQVTVASLLNFPKGLFIQTFDQSTGALVDEPFHVTAYCGPTSDFAVVASDGALARGSHVVSSSRTDLGRYEVVFDRNVGKCAFSATVGMTGAGQVVDPATISVGGLFRNHKGVFVQTLARHDGLVDMPFHLVVNCGPKTLSAVVNADATTARGADVVSSRHVTEFSPHGSYEVIFDRDVTNCAYTATLGSTTNLGAVDAPVTITTARRDGNPNGVFVLAEVTNGAPRDEPFHLIVTC